MHPFDIEVKRRTRIFSLDEDLAERLTAIARAKRMPSKTLITEWLREKVVEQAKTTP
jgi:predicted transcriptional regulator